MSPVKQATSAANSNQFISVQNLGNAPTGKILLKPLESKSSATFTQAGQQVIFLSPVKTNTSATSSISTKVLPVKSPQRPLAPAPTPKTFTKVATSQEKPIQLVRVVSLPTTQTVQQTTTTNAPSKIVPLRPIAPSTKSSSLTLPVSQANVSAHKVIIPASSVKQTSASVASTNLTSSQATFLTTGPQGGQVIMIPSGASFLTKIPSANQPATNKSVSFANPPTQRTSFVPIAPSPMTSSSNSTPGTPFSSLKLSNRYVYKEVCFVCISVCISI